MPRGQDGALPGAVDPMTLAPSLTLSCKLFGLVLTFLLSLLLQKFIASPRKPRGPQEQDFTPLIGVFSVLRDMKAVNGLGSDKVQPPPPPHPQIQTLICPVTMGS